METPYDVIVVGGGPSGALAGYTLAKAGLNILIIEQRDFPRRKVCGGGLTQRAFHEIPFDVSPALQQQVSFGHIGFGGKLITSIEGGAPIAYMVERATFDNLLLEKAFSQGAKAKLGYPVRSLTEKNDLIQIKTDQASFHCRYLIGADGVHSIIARETGLIPKRSMSLAYEARLSRDFSPESP